MKKKIITIIMGLIVLVAVVFIGMPFIRGRVSSAAISRLTFDTPNLSVIDDGEYKGSYEGELMAAEVIVIIADHQIEDIILTNHKTDRGRAAEQMIDNVIEAQSLEVDTISGATQSSKVILKSIEDALT